jgi:hypothetical protein
MADVSFSDPHAEEEPEPDEAATPDAGEAPVAAEPERVGEPQEEPEPVEERAEEPESVASEEGPGPAGVPVGPRPVQPRAREPGPVRPPDQPRRRWPWHRERQDRRERRVPVESRRPAATPPPVPTGDVPLRLCRSCGGPISRERLRAIPDAAQCIDCKRAGRPELPESAFLPLEESDVLAPPRVTIAPEVFEKPEPVALGEPEPALEIEPPPAPEPEPGVVGAAEPEPVPGLPLVPTLSRGRREWNVWELERLARQRAGRDMGRDEEWALLLVYLREFAGPDGTLPADFDSLVRESFPELIEAGAR